MIDIPLNSRYAIYAIFALLLTASATRLWLQYRHPGKDYTELRQRIQSWWWMIGILLVMLLASVTIAIAFFGFMSFLALKEFFSIVPTRQADRRVLFWAYVAIPLQYYWIATDWYGMFIVFIPVYVFLLLPMRAVLIGETQGFIQALGTAHWAVMLCVFCLSHVAYLMALPVQNAAAGYIGPVLYLLFITQFNDVCQYIWGKLLGRHKIIPKVSPKKTWEGFIGGFLTVTLVSGFVAPWLTSLSRSEGFIAGAFLAVAGFIGDVVISSVKRDLRIKDSGTLIPGHGGILDRIDSLIYTAPLFFHYLRYLHY
ncbi:MAG: phosphatidate cytidylyltransferase [Pseudomonadales bacterium]|jgi:phosphatidate cytidylyltransferase|nr:phosphatidate cytidylyltransferase [Pseudomonadales bacterium]